MRYFNLNEFACSCCDAVHMDEDFLEKLDSLRHLCGFPFHVTSGYRCKKHNTKIGGAPSSSHLDGKAADIALSREQALKVVEVARQMGFKGIGVQQKGKGRFIHLDDREGPVRFWSY